MALRSDQAPFCPTAPFGVVTEVRERERDLVRQNIGRVFGESAESAIAVVHMARFLLSTHGVQSQCNVEEVGCFGRCWRLETT